ncbi:hypothetical protein H6B10_16730, partial [Gemmiger formicilis]|uniref:hypothetical protein n=1 Tax=Gemmiger formicilis TaxID=745368 RepID=UPI00195B0FCC
PQGLFQVAQFGAAGAADVKQPHLGLDGIVHLFLGNFDLKKMFEAEQLDVMLCTQNMIHRLPNCEFHPMAEAALY